MASGPSLIVRLGVSGLAGVQAAFSRVQGMAGSLASGVQRLATSATGLLAGAAGVAGVAAGLKEALDMGGRLSDVSAKTGIATRSLVVLEQAFADSGVAAEGVGKAVAKMQDALVAAARGEGAQSRAFRALGLEVEELLALEPDRQLAEIGRAIAGIDDPARRTAAAMDVFGRSGSELMVLFRDASAFDTAAQRVGGLADVMERNAVTFDAISDAIGGLRVKAMGLFAGMAEGIAPELMRVANAVNALDLTPVGQRFGAFVALVVSEWQAGRIGELIGLTIESGFELGAMAARRTWNQLVAWLGSPGFWSQVAIGLVSVANSTTRSLLSAVTAILQPVVGWMTWQADLWRFAFESVWELFKRLGAAAVNWVATRIENTLNAAVALARRIPGMEGLREVGLGRVQPTPAAVAAPIGLEEAMEMAAESRRSLTRAAADFFEAGSQAARSVFGGELLENGGALEEIQERINALLEERTRTEEASVSLSRTALGTSTSRVRLADLEREAKDRLLGIEGRRAMQEGDFSVTAAEKWRLKRASLQEERRELERIVATLREKAVLEADPAAREQMLARSDAWEGRLAGVDRGLGTMGPDPHSLGEQMTAAVTGLEDQFGTAAQAIARGFTSVVGSAVDSVAQGIEGLIMGTMSWADALRNVAQTMLTSVVQAISRMFAEWMAKRALAAAKNMLFSAKEGAADTAAKAPGAVLTSISSWGVAAAVGVAAVIAALAAFGGFRSGGYTGDLPEERVAGVVHGREFVFDAPAVQRIGVENLEAMRSGVVPAAQAAPPDAGSRVNNAVQIAAFDSRLDARRWANSQEGEVWFVDMARRTAHRWNRA
jgi:hypothetical protein